MQFENGRIEAVHAALTVDGSFEPVHDAEAQLFADHDLASLVENRFGAIIDPTHLDESSRRDWIERATYGGEGLGPLRSSYECHYWLRRDGDRVGTLALATSHAGGTSLRLSSLYVRPDARGAHIGRRAVHATYSAIVAAGLRGLRLETEWCWPRAVAFYLEIPMWLRMWKRDLELVLRTDLPDYRVEIDGDDARFIVNEGAGEAVVIEARRREGLLDWRERYEVLCDRAQSEVPFMAPGTFALALARRGWPLFTSEARRDGQLTAWGGDFGGPDDLAVKIRQYEAWTRHRGWRVATPGIPGVVYREWGAEE